MSLRCIFQHIIIMQTPFRYKINIQKWYLGPIGVVGYLLMLGFGFTFDFIVSLTKPKVE